MVYKFNLKKLATNTYKNLQQVLKIKAQEVNFSLSLKLSLLISVLNAQRQFNCETLKISIAIKLLF